MQLHLGHLLLLLFQQRVHQLVLGVRAERVVHQRAVQPAGGVQVALGETVVVQVAAGQQLQAGGDLLLRALEDLLDLVELLFGLLEIIAERFAFVVSIERGRSIGRQRWIISADRWIG